MSGPTRSEAQVNIFDLEVIVALAKKLKRLEASPLYDAEVTVFDDTASYLLGSVFYDHDQEDWQWDSRSYGKSEKPS